MREVSHMERRLRATALDPGVRQEHFDALRAELRSRTRTRRRRPLFVTAASLVLVSLVVFQDQPLEGFNNRLEFTEMRDGVSAVFRPYEDAERSVSFSSSIDGTTQALAMDQANDMNRKWGIAEELFMSGLMTLAAADAYTFGGETTYTLIYSAEFEGEIFKHMEIVNDIADSGFLPWLNSPEFVQTAHDRLDGKLTELTAKYVELDGNQIWFQRWTAPHPTYGEIIVWRSASIN